MLRRIKNSMKYFIMISFLVVGLFMFKPEPTIRAIQFDTNCDTTDLFKVLEIKDSSDIQVTSFSTIKNLR